MSSPTVTVSLDLIHHPAITKLHQAWMFPHLIPHLICPMQMAASPTARSQNPWPKQLIFAYYMQRGQAQIHKLCSVTLKLEVELTSLSPSTKSDNLTSLSSMILPTPMTYHLVMVTSIHYLPQSPQLPPMLCPHPGSCVLNFTLYG